MPRVMKADDGQAEALGVTLEGLADGVVMQVPTITTIEHQSGVLPCLAKEQAALLGSP